MLSHDVILEARDWTFGDNHAAVHYVKAIPDCQTEIQVLLDEEDADFTILYDLQQRFPGEIGKDVLLPPVDPKGDFRPDFDA